MNSMSKPILTEIWGYGPTSVERGWQITWRLNRNSRRSIDSIVSSGTFVNRLLNMFPKYFDKVPYRVMIDNIKSLRHPSLQLFLIVANAISRHDTIHEIGCNAQLSAVTLRCVHHDLARGSLCDAINIIFLTLSTESQTHSAIRSIGTNVATHQIIADKCCTDLTCALLCEAEGISIPSILYSGEDGIFQLGTGAFGRLIYASSNDGDSYLGYGIANNKILSAKYLRKLGVSFPSEISFHPDINVETLLEYAKSIGFPCVVKPAQAEQGVGVTSCIKTKEKLIQAVETCRTLRKGKDLLILQSHAIGNDYRIGVFNGEVLYVIKRSPPVIVGNGTATVEELIRLENSRRKGLQRDGYVSSCIELDEEVLSRVHEKGFTLSSVLPQAENLVLRGNSNVTTGGVKEDIDISSIHPEVRKLCRSISATLRLDVCGIDYISEDISKPPLQSSGVVIEVNAVPQMNTARARILLENLFGPSSCTAMQVTVLICRQSDLNTSTLMDSALSLCGELQESVVAIPLDLMDCLSSRMIHELHQSCGLSIFSSPNQIFIDASLKGVLFIVTPEIVVKHGCPGFGQERVFSLVPPMDLCSDALGKSWRESFEFEFLPDRSNLDMWQLEKKVSKVSNQRLNKYDLLR